MTRITSTFNKNTDGWTIAGDVQTFEWRATGGDPSGHIYWIDSAAGADSYWQAPAKFTGDLSDYAGGRLTFDWYASADNYQTGDVVIIGANGKTLVGDVTNPGTDWTHASIKLSVAGEWHLGTIDGPLATAGQIKGTLKDVTSLQIRAEHVSGGESGGLDNVVLVSRPASPPAPSAFGEDSRIAPHGEGAAAPHHIDVSHVMLA